KRAVEEALSQARERPCPGLLERWWPVSLDVASADGLVEERFGLQGSDDPATQRLAARRVPGTEVDHLEAVRLLAVRDDSESVVAPDFFLSSLLRVPDLGLELRPIALVELTAERAVGNIPRHPFPREGHLDL